MAYIAEYERPYEGGYVDLPSETTPEMAEFINARDDAIIKIEEFLADLDIGSLGGDYALASEAGYSLDVSMNNEYVLTLSLKNKDEETLSSKSIDLPIESMIVDVDYTNGKLVLTLQNGNTVDVDVSDMVRGLVPTSRTIAGLDLADDITKEELKDAIGIYDDTVTAGEIKPWLYDTNGEEIIVGVFGGKPLYRKIFHVDVTTSNQSAEIKLSDVLDNFSQIENIVDYVVYTASHNRLPIVYVTNQFQGSSAMAFVSVKDDVIRINHGTSISFNNARFRIVLEYTKTTDAAGSGNNLNPYGIYSSKLDEIESEIEEAKNTITSTASTTMPNSYDGRLLVEEIGGVCEQGENPSPTNPQEIKKTVISEIRTHGKNLFDGINQSFWISFDCTRSGLTDGSSGFVLEVSDGIYTISTIVSQERLRVACANELNKTGVDFSCFRGQNKDGTSDSVTIDCSGYSYLIVNATDLSAIQVEAGTVATEYEPYTESLATLSQPIELYGIGDAKDILTSKEVGKKFKKITLTGNEAWYRKATSKGNYYFYTSVGDNFNSGVCMSNYFVYGGLNTEDNVIRFGGSESIQIRCDSFTTVEDFKTWLASANCEVVYELAEETTEELPIVDQIALNSIKTFDGITYLEFDSEIEPTFKGEYGTSLVGGYTLEGMLAGRNGELYGKDYNSRLSALETSVVNNI